MPWDRPPLSTYNEMNKLYFREYLNNDLKNNKSLNCYELFGTSEEPRELREVREEGEEGRGMGMPRHGPRCQTSDVSSTPNT